MARIAGVDLPRNKHVSIALTYIFGIGELAVEEHPRLGERGRHEESQRSERR